MYFAPTLLQAGGLRVRTAFWAPRLSSRDDRRERDHEYKADVSVRRATSAQRSDLPGPASTVDRLPVPVLIALERLEPKVVEATTKRAPVTDGLQPLLRGGRRGNVSGRPAVLVLHGGRENSLAPTTRLQLSYLRMWDMYAGLRRQAQQSGVYILRYRVRGWNPQSATPDPVADTRWALEQISERHRNGPIALLGHSMGGRTAFAVADHPQVVGVCALAPWLPQREALPPVRPDARFVLAHGTADRMTSAALSKVYARRLRAAGAAVARFEFPRAGHALLDNPTLWHRFAVRTTLGLVGDGELPPAIAAALSDAGPVDFTMTLAQALDET